MKYLFFFLILMLNASCGSSQPDQFRDQGSEIIRALLHDLKKVRTREELMDKEASISKNMDKLKKLVFEADKYLKSHPETEVPLFSRQNQTLSDDLQTELNRLLRIEGCRELINELLTGTS